MMTQLTTSGSHANSLTPFEEASLRALKFGMGLDNCQQLKAFLDISKDLDGAELTWLEKIYIAEVLTGPDFN